MYLILKKLFTTGTVIGRFEYVKLIFGLLLFPVLAVQMAVIIPPNNLLYNSLFVLSVIVLFVYLISSYTAAYKRFNNIFNNTLITVIFFIIYIFAGIIPYIVFNVLLILIPGKKKSDYFMPNKLFWLTFSLLIILSFTIRTLGINKKVAGSSMENTLLPNDSIFINIFDKDYHRGDIIVYDTNQNDKKCMIKRIVGLPGEKIEIKTLENGAKYVFINDKLLAEPYLKNIYDYPECSRQMKCEPLVVPKDSYYVLGDNRKTSLDSRYYGTINKEIIKGKVSHIWFPLSRRYVFTTIKYDNTDNIENTKATQ